MAPLFLEFGMKRKTVFMAASIFGVLAIILLALAVILPCIEADHYKEVQLSAAKTMEEAVAYIREDIISRGIPAEPEDKDKIMLLGPEFTELTTTPGEVKDKRGCLNPNFAAALVRYFHDAGLKPGDTIAVGTSGSYPGFAIATLIGATKAGLKARVIASLGSSMHGATRVEYTIFDILTALKEGGFSDFELVGVSRGGKGDKGGGILEGMYYEGSAELAGDICRRFSEKTGVPYIECDTLAESIARRMELFGDHVDMFVNVGGATVNNGAQIEGIPTFPSGLVLKMEDIPKGDVRGLCYEYAEKGLPILSLLYVKGLAEENGISYNPFPMAAPGEGIVSEVQYNNGLLVASIACTLLAIGIFIIGIAARRGHD